VGPIKREQVFEQQEDIEVTLPAGYGEEEAAPASTEEVVAEAAPAAEAPAEAPAVEEASAPEASEAPEAPEAPEADAAPVESEASEEKN
jgi:hypothetical protein